MKKTAAQLRVRSLSLPWSVLSLGSALVVLQLSHTSFSLLIHLLYSTQVHV
jgi:hypothetical protein